MTATYHISTDELNVEFLQNLKNVLGKKQLLITIEEDEDATFYLLYTKENRNKLKQSIQELESGNTIEFLWKI